MVMYNDQVWENKTKVMKLEQNNGSIQGVLFKINTNGLRFLEVIEADEIGMEKVIKKYRMKLTDKVLTIE